MFEINFIFSIGFRCYSPDFLIKYKLRKIAGPFDYLFVDLETAFDNINNNFEKFMSDIVFVNKKKKINKIYYSKEIINKKILDFTKNKNINYMRHNYNKTNLVINQNFINNISSNLYNWDRICIFHHHNIIDKSIYDIKLERIKIFNNIYKNNGNRLCLLYITRIKTLQLEKYKENIYNLKKKYNINCFLILIICSDNLQDEYFFENNILFIIKKVNNYDYQYKNNPGTDNNLNYDNEFNLIKKFFDMKLMDYKEIKYFFN